MPEVKIAVICLQSRQIPLVILPVAAPLMFRMQLHRHVPAGRTHQATQRLYNLAVIARQAIRHQHVQVHHHRATEAAHHHRATEAVLRLQVTEAVLRLLAVVVIVVAVVVVAVAVQAMDADSGFYNQFNLLEI